jgi:hypothetical protein
MIKPHNLRVGYTIQYLIKDELDPRKEWWEDHIVTWEDIRDCCLDPIEFNKNHRPQQALDTLFSTLEEQQHILEIITPAIDKMFDKNYNFLFVGGKDGLCFRFMGGNTKELKIIIKENEEIKNLCL